MPNVSQPRRPGLLGRAVHGIRNLFATAPNAEDLPAKPKPTGTEQTGTQTTAASAGGYGNTLTNPLPATWATYRTMRKDPTIALARSMLCGPILAGSWSLEHDDDADPGAVDLVNDAVMPLREFLLENALAGGIDFGWQAFELVYRMVGDRLTLAKAKPLLQDITTIMVDAKTGAYAGLQQGYSIQLQPEYTLLVPFFCEGTQWHGQSLLENARVTYNQYQEANAGAERYDKKCAGTHFVMHHPDGQSNQNGALTDNAEIAAGILEDMESSGSVSLPNNILGYGDVGDATAQQRMRAWELEILEDSGGRQPTFVDRLRFLDSLKVRALLMPERSVLEGQFGTKAESGVHANLALYNMERLHRLVVRYVNNYVVDRLLGWNYGAEEQGKVYIVANALSDRTVEYLQTVYSTILGNSVLGLSEFPTINTDSLKDKLQIPKAKEDAGADQQLEPLAGEDLARMREVSPAIAGKE